ncbi:MAG: hypothetical protein LBG93_04050 [Treponema sp.]|jgi:hypothetical protein|nr:hypothetical protein [Treponema sp.]
MKKGCAILAAVCVVLISGCFSPWTGGEGTITIAIGDRVAFAARSAAEPFDPSTMAHIISLTNPGRTITQRVYGIGTFSFSLPAGNWDIRIRAEDNTQEQTLRALGFGHVQVVARRSTSVNVYMIRTTEVANHNQLAAAITQARTDGLEKIIMITEDITVTSQLTIGPGRNITFASETDVSINRDTSTPRSLKLLD